MPAVCCVKGTVSWLVRERTDIFLGYLSFMAQIRPVRPCAVGAIARSVKQRRQLLVSTVWREPGSGQRIVLAVETNGFRNRFAAATTWYKRSYPHMFNSGGLGLARNVLVECHKGWDGECK